MNYTLIDADTHVTEPADLWTSRVPARWKERVPRVVVDPETGDQIWNIDGQRGMVVGITAVAGWHEPYPAHPKGYADAHPGSYDARARLAYMDELGIWAQVLYPNLVAFEGHAIMALDEPELRLAIVRAYNDYLTDFAAQEPGRFIPIACVPFWDREESIKEMMREYRVRMEKDWEDIFPQDLFPKEAGSVEGPEMPGASDEPEQPQPQPEQPEQPAQPEPAPEEGA